MYIKAGLLLATMLLCFLACPEAFKAAASPARLDVPADFETIQGAIDSANPGDLIFVHGGTYERISVYKPLTIVGQDSGSTTIDGEGVGTVVNITASDVEIRNFTIRDSGSDEFDIGISMSMVAGCLVSRNTIINNNIGILLNGSSGNMFFHNGLIDNVIQVSVVGDQSSNTWDNGYPSGGNYWSDASNTDANNGPNQDRPGSDGITDMPYTVAVENVDNYPLASIWAARVVNLDTRVGYRTIREAVDASETIDGDTLLVHQGVYYENVVVRKTLNLLGENVLNTIVDAGSKGSAFYLEGSSITVTGFTLKNGGPESSAGVYVRNSLSVLISGNKFLNCYNGIYMIDSSYIHAESNEFQGHAYACRLLRSNHSRLSGNIMTGGSNGISLDRSFQNMIAGNNITGHASNGIYLFVSSDNTIYYNNFVDNRFQFRIDPTNYQNALNMSYPLGGNFWRSKTDSSANYSGVDFMKGVFQNVNGSDGIGDTPFVPYSSSPANKDNYPQMQLATLTAKVDIHDVAVENVSFSPRTVYEGQTLNLSVAVSNLGNYTENLSLTTTYDGNLIGTTASTLLPREKRALNFTWSTAGIQPNRTYLINASAAPVVGEENVVNNKLDGGWVNVTFYRDLAVNNVQVLPTVAYRGWMVNLTATVSNLGNISETVHVRFTSGQVLNHTQTEVLDAHESNYLGLEWNTSTVAPGRNYTIAVTVDSVLDEVRLDNNNYTVEVYVKIVGDINGDNTVNILDIFAIARSFNAAFGDPLYEPSVDLNRDKVINILDIFQAAQNFGSTA